MASDLRYDSESVNTFLVAFAVTGYGTRKEAEEALLMSLPCASGYGTEDRKEYDWLDCWWVAEDDRHDGSDNDSAVFVPPAQQSAWAREVANAVGVCPGCREKNDCCCDASGGTISFVPIARVCYGS
jgi:hypothetical protein